MPHRPVWQRPKRSLLLVTLCLFCFTLLTPQQALAGAVSFHLDNQGLTLLSENQFKLGPLTLILSPWLYTEQQTTTFGLSEAALDLGIGRFRLTVGRQLTSFGPGRYNFLLLSPLGEGLTKEGLDQIGYSFATKRLRYQKFYAWVPANGFRLLLGQRATYDLGPFTFGFAETALAKEDIPDLYYLPLPLVPVGFYQHIADDYLDLPEARQSIKLLGELDLTLRLWSGAKIYASYLIDSRPFPSLQKGHSYYLHYPEDDEHPWKVGYQGGFEWDRPLGLPGIKLYTEYTRINQFTYTASEPFFNYTYKGQSLGGPLGPDADQLNLELMTTKENTWQFGLAYSRRRQGEGRIGDQWTYEPGQTEVFLTGVVETTNQISLTAVKNIGLLNSDQVALTISLARISNDDHQPGVVTLQPEVSVTGKVSW
ncbi:MAG: capsule assembly Wzi family protein [Firmicutes bacterium]|nr:capsule assembly Wzi family protein [Bacillota bacterium]